MVIESIIILSTFLTAVIAPLLFASTQKSPPEEDADACTASMDAAEPKNDTHFMKG